MRIWERQNESFERHKSQIEDAAEDLAKARVAAFIAGERVFARAKHRRHMKKSAGLYEPDVPTDQTALPEPASEAAAK